MKKNIERAKEEASAVLREVFINHALDYVKYIEAKRKLERLFDQLDEPEVLSQEWIDENKTSIDRKLDGTPIYKVREELLQNLLVPKQEEVDRAYRKGFKEGERQTAEYFESITEEPSKEQVWKYLSEHGIEVVDKEPETVADVLTTFWKSSERLKEVMSMEVEELEE